MYIPCSNPSNWFCTKDWIPFQGLGNQFIHRGWGLIIQNQCIMLQFISWDIACSFCCKNFSWSWVASPTRMTRYCVKTENGSTDFFMINTSVRHSVNILVNLSYGCWGHKDTFFKANDKLFHIMHILLYVLLSILCSKYYYVLFHPLSTKDTYITSYLMHLFSSPDILLGK